ncbi:MAG: arsenate reductase (glutaredoxin) [Zetaproteobacteria bacterium CG06_land_8_20_14_3_00_59_53]|nr:MAG: arsenate reductase (glutaredoxin) [Zetaproteobacteria bacterium CG2_30_59_37]PIO88699.1 MAG: arsenate reductase (glutaredoxin) [Zetaproteobacteria bacterium CG23_combo_of_CG06-09_8_20_14_all_59_86]PIQ63969.1 MAG: arsenate reductase (glutaredoxin) [Zetaproteobacteria bacterium CG11_big_fil_rev_8_21_14_0_20_59_439]PIU71658.1 MAG: arsenate reductase (glutaredoxin) [Zetaproteobacteria bacterium CG06_land_8_20_14_3_00_59_53]PIU96054.1 MAG: arsenate reductase (glutaredoxin) [Zetaproteobacteri
MPLTIYHNPRCSKSRATLALLQERGIEPEVVDYLNHPASTAELVRILGMLGKTPAQLLRTGEDEYREHFKGRELSDARMIELMVQYPKVIERPIVVNGDRAAVGRPPEAVLDILQDNEAL